MAYGQLLRSLASLSEQQLAMPINVRALDSSYDERSDRFTISRVSVWDDGHEDNLTADVDIFIERK